MTNKRIGFVGLGNMGGPMALNLVSKGFETHAFDLRKEAVEKFVSSSSGKGHGATSVVEAADGSSAIVLMVVNDAQARAILFTEGQGSDSGKTALSVLAKDAGVILMATCSPGGVQQLEKEIKTQRPDVDLIDAPVSGGVSGATSGGLTIMVGCSESVYNKTKPVLDAMGDKIFHMGNEVGKGSSMKAINQVLCGIHVAATAEALALASKAGIDRAMALEIVSNSAASSWMLRDRGPRMLQENPEIHSMTQIFVKDLGIVAEAGRQHGAALPLSAVAHQMFIAAHARGQTYMDDSTVIRSYEALNGPGPSQ